MFYSPGNGHAANAGIENADHTINNGLDGIGLVDVLDKLERDCTAEESVSQHRNEGRGTTAWLMQKKAFRWRALGEAPPECKDIYTAFRRTDYFFFPLSLVRISIALRRLSGNPLSFPDWERFSERALAQSG